MLLFLTGALADLPLAVLSAVVVNAVWGLMDVAAIRRYARVGRADLVAALAGLIGVVVAVPFYGLVSAVGLSLLAIVYRSARLDIDVMGKIDGEKAAWGSVTRAIPSGAPLRACSCFAPTRRCSGPTLRI